MSINTLLEDSKVKPWCNLFMQNATVYQDLKVNGNTDIDGEIIVDSAAVTDLIVTDTALVNHLEFSDPVITGSKTLSYYEHDSFNLNFIGPTTTTFLTKVQKIGKQVIVVVESTAVFGNGASAGMQTSNAIPLRFRPTSKVTILIRTKGFNGGSEQVGHAVLETNGAVVCYPNLLNGSVFTAGVDGGGVLDEMVFNYIN